MVVESQVQQRKMKKLGLHLGFVQETIGQRLSYKQQYVTNEHKLPPIEHCCLGCSIEPLPKDFQEITLENANERPRASRNSVGVFLSHGNSGEENENVSLRVVSQKPKVTMHKCKLKSVTMIQSQALKIGQVERTCFLKKG